MYITFPLAFSRQISSFADKKGTTGKIYIFLKWSKLMNKWSSGATHLFYIQFRES